MKRKYLNRVEGWLIVNLFFIITFPNISNKSFNRIARSSHEKKEMMQHEVTVTLKLLQIYVTDKKGIPITYLDKSDFQLFDNGKPVEITEFEKHILTLPETKTQELKPEVIPESPLQMRRKFFLFFDFAFNDGAGIMRSKKAAVHFIDTKVSPTDELGVLSYSINNGLILHEYLTRDHKKVRDIIETFGIKKSFGRAEDVVGKYWEELEKMGQAAGGAAGSQLSRMAAGAKEFDRRNYKAQVSNFSSEVKDLAKALRYIPGNKQIIFFSAGVANFILYGKLEKWVATREERRGDLVLRKKYEEMGKELGASNSPIFAVNVAGLASAHFKSTDFLGTHSLNQLAKITGGVYFDNVNNYEEIMEEIQKMTSAYYVLGYYIDDKWDGKYHDIKVKVKRKRCKVYGQEGYFNPKPFTEYTRTEKMLHLIDLALSDKPQLQEPIRFPAHASQWKADEESNVLISVKIAGDRLKEIQGRKMEVVTLILNQKNDVVELKQEECGISQSVQDDTYYSTYVSLPPGEYDCRVIIRNLETGKGAVGSSLVTISRPSDSDLSLLAPVLFVHKESPHSLGSMPGLSSFGFTDYVPVVDGVIRRPQSIIAYMNIFTGAITEPEIKLSVQLFHLPSEKEVSISSSIVRQRKEKENQIFLVEIPLDEVQPGKYSLNIIVEELKKGFNSQATAAIQVR